MRPKIVVGLLAVSALVVGCGGTAVIDAPLGQGGATTSTGTTTTSTTITTTTTTTALGCDTHADCIQDVCIFETGVCSEPCQFGEPCGVGFWCDECATSSCPECFDCLAACVVAGPGQCDDHNDCSGGDACIYWTQQCAPPCNEQGECDDPSLVCDPCATAPCPFCSACMAACVLPF